MPGNYFVEKRRIDKQKLLKLFNEHPDAEENKLVAIFSMQTGYRLETIKEMVEELRQADLIK